MKIQAGLWPAQGLIELPDNSIARTWSPKTPRRTTHDEGNVRAKSAESISRLLIDKTAKPSSATVGAEVAISLSRSISIEIYILLIATWKGLKALLVQAVSIQII